MSIQKTLLFTLCLFFLATGFAHAALVTVDDSYGIPASRVLLVEPSGVLDNDTLDGQNAGDGGVTAILHTDVSKGTLACPGVGPGLCDDGSFEYTPGTSFDGTDSFVYQAVSSTETSPPTTVTLTACTGGPTVFTCWLETSYLNKLSELGYNNTFVESFEGVAWDVARSPSTAPSIVNKGVTWTTNHPTTNEITTGSGPARTGMWGVYDPDHGVATGTPTECDINNPPVHCLPYDGFSGSLPGPGVLYGVGGYIGGYIGASIDIILDGTHHNVGQVPGFFSVIDTTGFNAFEYRELDGKIGQALFIFGDDFTIATSATLEGSVQFGAPTYTVAEDGVTATINVTRTDAIGAFGAASVDYVITDGTANAGSDYTGANGTVSFAAGDAVTKTFSITIINSPGTYEGNETVNLALSNVSGASLGAPSSAVLTITENDLIPPSGSLQFDMASYSVAEDGVTATINVTRSGGDFGAASVDYTITDGTANAGSDYTAANGTVNFADGDAVTKSFAISIINSPGTYEGNETVNLALSNVSGASPGTPATAELTITENDPVPPAGTLQFSAPTYSVAENGTSVNITVTRTGGSFGAVSAIYATANGSAAAGSDYTAANGTVNFANGDTIAKTFTVNITNDTTYEGDETVNLSLSGADVGTQSSAVLTITEDDAVPPSGALQFSAPTYSVAENGTSVNITVTRAGGSFGAASADYTITAGTASAGSDYTAANGTVNFTDGDAVNKTFAIGIINSPGTYEGDETVNLALSNVSGASPGTPATAELTITENDPVPPAGTLQFSAPTYSVAENGTSVNITVTRTGGSFGAASVDYTITDGTANAGSDYTATNGAVNFAAGDAVAKSFSITIINSPGTYEGDETVNLALSNATGASLGAPSSAELTITENDPVPAGTLQFSATTYGVNENGNTATITVTRVNGSFGIVGVDYASTDGSATDGSDYTAVSGALSFADGEITKTFTVPIFDDVDYEGDESVNLFLSFPTGGASLGLPSTAVLTITEDDPVPPAGSLQFSTPSYTEAENGTAATITVTRINGSFGTVGVDYMSSDGTASAGSDYTAVSGSLSFADGVTSQTFTIDIFNDADYEGDETVNLTLSNPSGGAGLDSPSTAVLTITEDDPVPPAGSLQLSAVSYSAAEDGVSATITVSRVGGSFGTVGVDYASNDGAATAGSDYAAVIGSLSFADGVTSQTFTIDIFDDADYEGNETVNLILSNPSGGAGLGSPSSAILTITEDDPVPPAGSLQFSLPTYTVAENGTVVSITVTRDGGSFGTVGVDYASSDDTATAGTDYTAVSGSLSFADGVTSQIFTITILDDTDYEGNETVYLSLSNPGGGAGLGSPAITALTITEDDPVPPSGSLQFSDTGYQVNEKRNSANITVTRVGGSYGSVDVDYATSDGTATAGSDYTAVSGRLSFADGVTSQKFSIEILGDAIYEDNESLNLILSNPAGGAGLGSPSTASLLIVDDDTQTDEGSTGGSSGGSSIDLITLMLLFSFYLRKFRKNIYS